MRLFHVSEEPDIKAFVPRIPNRKDVSQDKGLVWALCERTMPNFLTPRNCPRVTYHLSRDTLQSDINRFFDSKAREHAIHIEKAWLERMDQTTLTIYEFDPKHFVLQDDIAGYYVSDQVEVPIASYVISELRRALDIFDVELHVVDDLSEIMHQIQSSSFHWSLCRMGFAKKPIT